MDNNLYLLEYNKNASIVSFNKKIRSLEFVELIGNMDLSHCINCQKRDIYLKRHGEQLFKETNLCKDKRKKIQIEIKHETVKISAKTQRKGFIRKILNIAIKFLRNIFKWRITIISHSKNTAVLSEEEIDQLLTAINSGDETQRKGFIRKILNIAIKFLRNIFKWRITIIIYSKNTAVPSEEEIDELLTAINSGNET
jgi:hypothetical protein